MNRILVLLGLMIVSWNLSAQENQMRKVPKQMSFEAGYRYITGTEFPNSATHGYTVLFDYGWQLSGLNGTRSGYITVPLGITQMYPDSDSSSAVRIISYGWTTRHELKPKSKGWVPYVGYALMLNNYSEKGTEGRIFGHQTRFSLGLNHYNSSRFDPYVQVDYSMTNYPEWGKKGSRKHNFLELKFGVRI